MKQMKISCYCPFWGNEPTSTMYPKANAKPQEVSMKTKGQASYLRKNSKLSFSGYVSTAAD